MKTKFSLVGFVAFLILVISTSFVGCSKDDVDAVVRYVGKVVYAGTTDPFQNLEVKVTNGEKIHCVDHTDAIGSFTLNVNIGDIDGNYYVLIGDSSCVTKRIELSGFGSAEVNLGTIEIEGPTTPIVKTKSVSGISDTRATSGGKVTSDGRSSVTARGVCWSKFEYPTVDGDHTVNGSGVGEFNSTLTDLEPGTTYYVRAYATNKQGTGYGEQYKFFTSTGLPEVTAESVFDITPTSAKCKVNVASTSGYAITACGICWSDRTATPTMNDNHTEEVASTGKFTSMMIGLEPNHTYYVRAYAVNEKGTGYSASISFTTANGLPTLETINPGENVTETTAISGGKITDDGGFDVTARGVCWGTVPNPTISNNVTTDGSGIGGFSSTISGIDLTGSTPYYVRAYATNQNGTAYGNEFVVSRQNLEYKNLPRLEIDDYVYVIYHDLGDMFYDEAVQTVKSMSFAGYDDWMLVPSSEQMRYIMVTCLEGWKDMWGNSVIIYTKENPSPTPDFPTPGYYWTSDTGCIDGYQDCVYGEPGDMYDWTTYTQYYATAASPYCAQVSSNRNRVRPIRRYKRF